MTYAGKLLAGIVFDESKQLRFHVTDTVAYDTNVDITIPAGTYYVAWDMQDDDLLYQIMSLAYTALDALADGTNLTNYNTSDANGKPHFGINSDGKVTVTVGGGEQMRIDWTVLDGAEIGGALGFTTTATKTVITSGATANHQHAYGWYDDPSRPCLVAHNAEDSIMAEVAQSVAISGASRTTYMDERYRNTLGFQLLPRTKTFSGGQEYAQSAVRTYAQNVPLECWWRQARRGTPFRVYMDGRVHSSDADLANQAVLAGGVDSASNTTTVTDAGKSLSTNPRTHVGRLMVLPNWGPDNQDMRFYVSTHTSTVYTLANSLFARQHDASSTQYYILDQRYRTYFLDMSNKEFAPRELPNLDLYDIEFPLLKYVTA